MNMVMLFAGLMLGLVPIIGIIRVSPALLLRCWIAVTVLSLLLLGFMAVSLPHACRTGRCLALEPWLPGVAGGLLVATLIGGIRWLASRGKRPW